MRILKCRLSIAAILASAALAACGRDSGTNESANAANDAQPQAVPSLPIPTPEPPLGRSDLLLAAIDAASDYAAGADDSERQKELAGKKFLFRIRFGCDGPSSDSKIAPFGWSLNEQTGALKAQATPDLSLENAPIAKLAGETYEAVEGFWIRRPWLLTATCPKRPKPAEPPLAPPEEAKAPPTATKESKAKAPEPASPAAEAAKPADSQDFAVGIAHFFTQSDPRTARRSGRPYEVTKRLKEGNRPSGGFDLVVSGRLTALPNGRVIACTRSKPDVRPTCVISVEFGTVSIERVDTHEKLGEWGTG